MNPLLNTIALAMPSWLESIKSDFYSTFIANARYRLFANGLWMTLRLTFFAAIFGILLGIIFALMRLSRTKNGKKTVFSVFAGIYIDVIRGTPAVLQLLILYFAVLPATASKELAAVIAFSINSGAYVAEIVRAGIQAVDYGQTEAGRSLGLSQRATMQYIIIPQAMKNILPALVNEFIVLLKETAVAGYIGVMDLTKVSDFIVSRTFIAFMPLIGTAVIYFTIVKILSVLLGKLERRLRQSDSR
jgi:polar amino acid transport system permease protein/polar amino acid transport system substrate-binding protein